jgi:D-hydroxyproline dehydrogenase subunit gamma
MSGSGPATDGVVIHVNGRQLRVEPGITVAAALENERLGFRRSVTGEVRGPLCGMGICHECRVTIDGVQHRRACLEIVAPNMEVQTGG